jgi:hypothetical protein
MQKRRAIHGVESFKICVFGIGQQYNKACEVPEIFQNSNMLFGVKLVPV